MSFVTERLISCPSCGAENRYKRYDSINGSSRPRLREAVLSCSLMRVECEACGDAFRVEPDLTYVDHEAGFLVRALRVSELSNWKDHEGDAHVLWFSTLGPVAPETAQVIGADLRPRLVFGWGGLREKILCGLHRIDDAHLELLKLEVLLATAGQAPGDHGAHRLAAVSDDKLLFEVLIGDAETPIDALVVPRERLSRIAADAEGWAEAREMVTGAGFFVDVNRALVPQDEAAA